MYHPFLRQMCKIATMEVESENTLAMNLFWEMLNEALQEYTTNPTIRFRSYGYTMDEAGAFWSSIANIQGEEDFQRSVSCEKHFDSTVLRQEKTLVGGEVKSEVKFLCNSLQKAETPLVLSKVVKDPALLICVREGMLNKTREQMSTLKNWMKLTRQVQLLLS